MNDRVKNHGSHPVLIENKTVWRTVREDKDGRYVMYYKQRVPVYRTSMYYYPIDKDWNGVGY